MYSFMKRHSDLSIRKPEATSVALASGFNPIAFGKFYSSLSEVVDKYKLEASQVFNLYSSVVC